MSNTMFKLGTDTVANYAQEYNNRFTPSHNVVVNIADRIEQTLALNPQRAFLEKQLEHALRGWRVRNKNLLANDCEMFFAQLQEAALAGLGDIMINLQLQRIPSIEDITRYISRYNGFRVQPIKVYRCSKTGKLVCWDGQHTVIMLWLIITRVLKLNPAEVQIPVAISNCDDPAMMREALIGENSEEGSRMFDDVDLIDQYVYSVEFENSPDEKRQSVHNKYMALASRGMFIHNPRMFNSNYPGALTRTEEFMDPKYDDVVTDYFADWCVALNEAGRSFGGTEVDLMYSYFQACVNEGIDVDLDYIYDVAEVCKRVRGDDFDGAMFWNRCKNSYAAWFAKQVEENDELNMMQIRHEGNKRNKMLTMLCAMLESENIKHPANPGAWAVPTEDLF